MSEEPRKHSVVIAGHATSITLEPPFWDELRGMAEARGLSINQLVAEIDHRRSGNLSSAIRIYVLMELKRAAAESAPDGGP